MPKTMFGYAGQFKSAESLIERIASVYLENGASTTEFIRLPSLAMTFAPSLAAEIEADTLARGEERVALGSRLPRRRSPPPSGLRSESTFGTIARQFRRN